MAFLDTCKKCGIPARIGKYFRWNSNGTITQKPDPSHRMLFHECSGLDKVLAGIEDIIGVPIEKQIIESKSRAVVEYINKQKWGPLGELARPAMRYVIREFAAGAKLDGLGAIQVKELDWKKGYLYCEVSHPYSVPLFWGDIRGSFEAVRKRTNTLVYQRVGLDRYTVKCFWAPHAPELADRLPRRDERVKPGDIQYERCPACGVPNEVSRFRWDLEKGIISHPELGLRMAIFGSAGIQSVFDKLESELGDSIPDAIIEAQRRYSVSTMNARWKCSQPEEFRLWLAVGGMGNLVQLEQTSGGYSVRIENPGLPLITVGEAVAFYEFTTGGRGSVQWEITDQGDLLVELSPA